ncbi:MAG: protein arginine kinase [Phycisphaerae bacterium]|nr:protein arginine kinase [Phycisphaerae bacterium]
MRGGADWLRGKGAHGDVVISSRARLARNLTGYPFLCRATTEQRLRVLERVRAAAADAELAERTAWMDVHRLATVDRTLLVERHLISKEHAKGEEPRAAIISLPDERVSVMVNEEDHLRVQVLRSGLALDEAWAQIDDLDDRLESRLDYAYSARFGYLTACPTNVGTGLRMSVMLHLPGLRLTGEMEKVKRATKDMSLAVRGYYGEGSEATGDFYQISNQTTLGKTESVILHELAAEILPQVIEYERTARRLLIERRRRHLEDQVFRALGVLRSARMITPEETLGHLSMVRLGVLTGLIADVAESTVNQLVILIQPAHLQRVLGRELDQQERREARADLLRQRLGPC